MTYEKAREFLMNKKVFVKNKSKEIQKKLFEIGFKWGCHSTDPINLNRPFIYIWDDKTLCCGSDVDYFYNHSYEEISAEDILNIKVERLPKTWEEFCENNPIKEGEVAITTWSTLSKLTPNRKRFSDIDKYVLPNISAAKAHLALMQLHQLRDCYRGTTLSMYWYSIIMRGKSDLIVVQDNNRFLSFPTRELAEEFLSSFKDLIKEAGDLI